MVTSIVLSRGPAAALLTLAAGLTGCSSASEDETPATLAGPAPVLTSATLTDDVDPAADTWSTTWEACFELLPGAEDLERWEVRAVTAEGVSPRIEELRGRCVELQLAQGPGTAPADDPGRTAALADAASLGYQARGVRADGSVTPWSEPVVAGSTG